MKLRVWTLAILYVLQIVPSWGNVSMADVHLAMSSRPQSERVHLGAPALTSDGSLAVLAVSFPGNIGHLVIYNIDRSKYRIIEKPDDEAWISPSFSRDGDKVAFIRYCATCDSRGFQVASYNIRTNQVTTLTQGEDLYRGNPNLFTKWSIHCI